MWDAIDAAVMTRSGEEPGSAKRAAEAEAPLGREGRPEEVAAAGASLASDEPEGLAVVLVPGRVDVRPAVVADRPHLREDLRLGQERMQLLRRHPAALPELEAAHEPSTATASTSIRRSGSPRFATCTSVQIG